MTPGGGLAVRVLPGRWDPYREELWASQVIVGGELPGESVQRFIKRKWCNLVQNSNISISMVIQSSFRHRDRIAF